jgi:hypothetical protein
MLYPNHISGSSKILVVQDILLHRMQIAALTDSEAPVLAHVFGPASSNEYKKSKNRQKMCDFRKQLGSVIIKFPLCNYFQR